MPYFDDEGEVDCGHDNDDFCGDCEGCRACGNCYCDDEDDDLYYTLDPPIGAKCS